MKKLSEKQISKIDTKIAVHNGLFVVLVDTTGDKTVSGSEENASIYCINENYEIIWQVQYPSNSFEQDPIREFSDPFVYISLDEEGKLHADKFRGNEYIVDINTGVAEHTGYHR